MIETMSEALTAAVVSLVGLLVIVVSCVVIAVRSHGKQVVSWKGFGVTFEIKPCATCRQHSRLEK